MDTESPIRSKNRRLSAAVVAQIPEALLRLLLGEQGGSEPRDSIGTSSAYAERYHALLRKAVFAASMDGSYLAVACSERFMLLGHPEDASMCYRLISVGSEAALPGETVTAIYCMDIYAPSLLPGTHHGQQRQQQQQQGKQGSQLLCVVVGYSSGYLRVFSMYGHLLTAHQLHSQPLLRIQHRMPLHAASEGGGTLPTQPHSRSTPEDTEEVCLAYADGTMVSIDGQSLYLALRVCQSEAAAGEASEPTFQYKKWSFDVSTPQVSDAVSYGPVVCRDPLARLAMGSMTSNPLPSDATARFLVAPMHGKAAFGVFMTNEDVAVSYSAVDIAGRVAARVTGAVLNMAKSYFWRGSPLLAGGGSDRAEVARQSSPGKTDRGTTVPCVLAVRDSPRKVLEISLAPVHYGLAALTDTLGRVMLFDLESSEVVYMLKGLRGSRCAWLEADSGSASQRRVFVVICASKRGVVEVYELGSMESPLASINVGPGWAPIQCPTQPLGGSLLVGSAGNEHRAALPCLASCLLVNDRGQVARIAIDAS
ncbi:hypothetical protein LPJ61_001181 [Coemansia biformis]|uniref:Rab3-GAP regulatory subunit N-terminal domain-containing protein n=1 Tax=Coemansia biformis TaxID=1286918 RepID=A0A9W7YH81_9FUNG|nr:hypothetical protein LPJ61_001181 [Coemansia biformis]